MKENDEERITIDEMVTGGREPGRTGGGRGREAGAEVKKAIVCCLLLSTIQSKTLIEQSFEISI